MITTAPRTIISAGLLIAALAAGGAIAQTTPTPSRSELAQRFLLTDRDGDGAISRQESLQSGWLVDQRNNFDSLDADRSGTVTLAEISTAIAAKVKGWMTADTDGDGRISAAEAQGHGELGKTFGRVDDGDGYATQEELQRWGERSYYEAGDLPSVAPNIFEKRF